MRITRVERFMVRFRESRDGGVEPPLGDEESRQAIASQLPIESLMERNLATVAPGDSVLSAVRLMIEHRISSIPVVDPEGRIVGALNEGDLMQVFYEPQTKCVADVMTRKPIIVSIDAPLVDVIDHLMSSNFRRVLVEENGRLVGVITRSHVMPALLATLEAMDSD